jgi:hypothetical protein
LKLFFYTTNADNNMAGLAATLQQKLGFSNQKALLLGAGFVTKPTVEILANSGVEVTIGKL